MAGLKNQFLVALSFLTIFKVDTGEAVFSSQERIFARSAAFFPLVGALLGLILAAVDALFALLFPLTVSSVVVLLAGAFFTAGLHLDGFADTMDGLGAFFKGGREKALAVMKDSRSGALGVLGLVLLILFKYSLLVEISGSARYLSLFLMPVSGRWLLAPAGQIYPYARSASGLGEGFAGRITNREVVIALCWVFFCALAGAAAGGAAARPWLFALTLGGLFISWAGAALFAAYLARCFGGMTGDTLGAVSELGELFFLLGVAALTRIWA